MIWANATLRFLLLFSLKYLYRQRGCLFSYWNYGINWRFVYRGIQIVWYFQISFSLFSLFSSMFVNNLHPFSLFFNFHLQSDESRYFLSYMSLCFSICYVILLSNVVLCMLSSDINNTDIYFLIDFLVLLIIGLLYVQKLWITHLSQGGRLVALCLFLWRYTWICLDD